MKSMDKDPKAKKSAVRKGNISKSDWKKMPKNKEGVITYDTIKKTSAANRAKAKGAKPAAAKKKSYPKLMMKSSSKPMSK
jgi:hypothetical protein